MYKTFWVSIMEFVLLLWIQLLNYTPRCFKQFLKASTELVNIYVILQKYFESQNTWQAALKQPKPTIVSSEGCFTSEMPRNFLKVSKY